MRRILPVAVVAAGIVLSACGAGAFQGRAKLVEANGQRPGQPSYSQSETIILTAPPTIDVNNIQATATISRDPKTQVLVDKTYQPPIPKNSATVIAKANSEFGKPVNLRVSANDTVALTLTAPKSFIPNELGFPGGEYGKNPNKTAPKDRAIYFTVKVKNTSARTVSINNMNIEVKAGTLAPICRQLLGGDETVISNGVADEFLTPYDSVDPGQTVSFGWAVVCQASKGMNLGIDVKFFDSSGKPYPKIYNDTMP